MDKPSIKPSYPYFSSGPCAKPPGWSLNNLKNGAFSRSHRSEISKSKLKYVKIIVTEKKFLSSKKINLINKKKIRLFGIDAPEWDQKCQKIWLTISFFSFNKDYFCVGEKINNKQVYDLNGRIVIGLLHNGKSCRKDEIDFVKSHQITGRFCEFRDNTPIENLEAGMGDIFIKLSK